jgi:hypothetical protein
MAGINHLYDLYKEDPKFVENLLDSEIEVEEKLNGSRFSFELVNGDEFKFYKRNDSAPITKIDRTLARYYEKAISHFEAFPEEKLEQIPDGWRFGFEYFPNLMPVRISYDRMPLNNLVLTEITIRDPQGKILEVISDKETLDNWAEILEVESPPIIFKGKLSPEQKKKILTYLHTPSDEVLKKFKVENFAAYFLNALNPGAGKSFMQNTLDKDIEAIVFRFDGKNPLKIMNPFFSTEKSSEKKDEKPSDIYSLTLVIFQEFFNELDFKKIKLKSKNFEERYIEFICKAFNLFCNSQYYKNNFSEQVDFELPSFLTRAEAEVNFSFVKDPETLELLKKGNVNRELFKIMLASMRAHKKKPFGFFKKELIWHHNKLVDSIADYINAGIKESFLAFQEFKEVFLMSESEKTWEEFGYGRVDEVSFPSFSEVEKPKREEKPKNFLSVLKNIVEEIPTPGEEQPINLLVSKTLPYHNGIVTALRDVHQQTNKKSLLILLGNPFSSLETFHEMSKEFLENQKKFIEGILIFSKPSYTEVKSYLAGKKLSPSHFCGSKKSFEDFCVQTSYSPEFIDPNDYFGTELPLVSLKNGDYNKFREICPSLTHNYFYKLKQDLPNS